MSQLQLLLLVASASVVLAGYSSSTDESTDASNSIGGTKCDKNPLNELTFQLSGSSLHWPCESTKNIYVQSGRYVPRNVIVTRAQLQRDSAFVALPRYKQGVPFTLGKVNLKKGECLTKIAPYPCWAIQEEGNCQALQSVVDIAVDQNVSAINASNVWTIFFLGVRQVVSSKLPVLPLITDCSLLATMEA